VCSSDFPRMGTSNSLQGALPDSTIAALTTGEVCGITTYANTDCTLVTNTVGPSNTDIRTTTCSNPRIQNSNFGFPKAAKFACSAVQAVDQQAGPA
jgi:hypothetical protein